MNMPSGRLHPITLGIREIAEIFGRMGFSVVSGPELEDEWHNFTKAQLQHPAHPAEAPPVDATDDGNGTTDFEQSMASEPAPVSHSAEVPGFASVGELMAQVNKTYRLTQATIFDILGLEYLGQLREKYSNLSDAWAKIVESQEEKP